MLNSVPVQIAVVALSLAAFAYYNPQYWANLREFILGSDGVEKVSITYHSSDGHETLFTPDQLTKFNGEDGSPIYLALLGSVYDVSKGIKHYGTGCSYNFFVGRDASVAFVTGEFEHYDPMTADDVLKLKPNELLSLANWKRFYDTDYTYVGKLIGRFFDETGRATPYRHKFDALIDQAAAVKAVAEKLRNEYPDCNIEWTEERGTRVWCTTKSGGGAERDWIGHPRKLYAMGGNTFRCACIKTNELNSITAGKTMWQPYENCNELAHECFYKLD